MKYIEEALKKKIQKLLARANMLMTNEQSPELDYTPELEENNLTAFQECIGILRWAIEIGRMDILTEVSMLSACQVSPRQGHLKQAYHIFAYLKHKPKLISHFNLSFPNLESSWEISDNAETFSQ